MTAGTRPNLIYAFYLFLLSLKHIEKYRDIKKRKQIPLAGSSTRHRVRQYHLYPESMVSTYTAAAADSTLHLSMPLPQLSHTRDFDRRYTARITVIAAARIQKRKKEARAWSAAVEWEDDGCEGRWKRSEMVRRMCVEQLYRFEES